MTSNGFTSGLLVLFRPKLSVNSQKVGRAKGKSCPPCFQPNPSAFISLGRGPRRRREKEKEMKKRKSRMIVGNHRRVVAISDAVLVLCWVTLEGLLTIRHWELSFSGTNEEIREKIKRAKRNRWDGSRVAIEHSKTFDGRALVRARNQ